MPDVIPAGPAPAASDPASAPASLPDEKQAAIPAPSAADPAQQQQKTEPGEPQAEPDNEGQQGEEEIKQRRRSARQRIAELTAQKYAHQAEIAHLRAELKRLRTPVQPADIDALPLEQQDALRVRQAVREERADEIETEMARKAAAAAQAQFEMLQTKVEAVADRIPDIREKVFDPTLPVSDAAAELIAESDKGAELMYWLATHRGEAERIYHLPPIRQAAELARIEARLQAAPQVRRTSRAPNPVPTVGGGMAPVSKDPAAMTQAEYEAWRRGKT